MSEADRVAVKNAADAQQVKRAGRKDRDGRAEYLAAIRGTLATLDGRRFCWELLVKARVFESIYSASALIHYNAGRQDYGHELMADLIAADEGAYELMEREARARAKRDRESNAAAHTASAEEHA